MVVSRSTVALGLIFALAGQSLAQEKGRKATVQGVLKARIEFKNTKNMAIEILADGEESPRRYGVPYLPKEKGPVGDVHPAVLRASIGDRVSCDLIYGAYGYESGFTVVTFQVIKKADKKVGGLIDYFLPRRALLPENVSPEAEQKEKIHTFARSQSDLTVNRTAWHLKTQREWPSRTALLG